MRWCICRQNLTPFLYFLPPFGNGESRHNSIALRSILIGLFWVILLVSIVPYNDFYLGGAFLAGNHFPIGPVFILLILVLLVNLIGNQALSILSTSFW